MAVLVGGDQFKIRRLKPCPADSVFGGNCRKNRICCKRYPHPHLPDLMHRLPGKRILSADGRRLIEFVPVEGCKDRYVLINSLSKYTGKRLPEAFLIRAASVIYNHRAHALPNAVKQLLFLVPKRSELLCKHLKIGTCKCILIHREQSPVKIKKHHLHTNSACSLQGLQAL